MLVLTRAYPIFTPYLLIEGLAIVPCNCLGIYVDGVTLMSDTSKAFLELVSAATDECSELLEQLRTYSDKQLEAAVTPTDLTQATAFKNSVSSLRKLVESVNNSKKEAAPECSIKAPAQQCSI